MTRFWLTRGPPNDALFYHYRVIVMGISALSSYLPRPGRGPSPRLTRTAPSLSQSPRGRKTPLILRCLLALKNGEIASIFRSCFESLETVEI